MDTILRKATDSDLPLIKNLVPYFDLVNVETKAHLPEHHLYGCEDGAYELRKHLAFCDFMRQHPEWRERLNRLKRELRVKHNNDRQAYIDGKASMVQEITKLAMAGSADVRNSRGRMFP